MRACLLELLDEAWAKSSSFSDYSLPVAMLALVNIILVVCTASSAMRAYSHLEISDWDLSSIVDVIKCHLYLHTGTWPHLLLLLSVSIDTCLDMIF